MKHDTDGFNRWDAGQRLAVTMFECLIAAHQQQQTMEINPVLLEVYRGVLQEALQPHADQALIAHMLTLPSQSYLAELADVIDVNAIHQAHQYVKKTIAVQLKEELLTVYQALQPSNTHYYDKQVSAARALKNTCLQYLMMVQDDAITALCMEQFNHANNMTDAKSALIALINSEDTWMDKNTIINNFYDKWRSDVLVIEQWFAVQAASPTYDLTKIKQLVAHPAFDIGNPNIVRAVIGSFANFNHINFHDESGSGYDFLAEQVLLLDPLNPQMAARLLTPLTRWRKYNMMRQLAMKAALSRVLAKGDLSKDVFEIASKGLQR
jgi:aminopeptidase N